MKEKTDFFRERETVGAFQKTCLERHALRGNYINQKLKYTFMKE